MGYKITKTNHYILLTNVSIKRCIIPSSKNQNKRYLMIKIFKCNIILQYR